MIFLNFKKIGYFLCNLSQGLIYQEILRFPQGFPQSFPQLLWVRNKAAIAAFFWQIIACGRGEDGLEAMQFLHEPPSKFQVAFRLAAPLNDGGKNGLLGRGRRLPENAAAMAIIIFSLARNCIRADAFR